LGTIKTARKNVARNVMINAGKRARMKSAQKKKVQRSAKINLRAAANKAKASQKAKAPARGLLFFYNQGDLMI
jgi:hypothetical protein